MSRITLPSKYDTDIVNAVFDFTSQLAIGETISTATMTVYVFSGNETSPTLTAGTGSISGSQVTSALSSGLVGTIYDVECQITTSLSQTLRIQAYQAVVPDFV